MYETLLLVKCVIELVALTSLFTFILRLAHTDMVESSSSDKDCK